MKITNWKIGARLGGAFALILAFMCGLVWLGVSSLGEARKTLDTITRGDVERSNMVYRTRGIDNDNCAMMLMFTDVCDDRAKVTELERAIDDNHKKRDDTMEKLLPMLHVAQARALHEKEEAAAFHLYDEAYPKLRALIDAGKKDEGSRFLAEGVMLARQSLLAAEAELGEHLEQRLDARATEASSAIAASSSWMFIVGLGACLLALLVGWQLTRSITGPLADAVSAARALARGDTSLVFEARSTDEAGEVVAAVGEVRASLEALAQAAERLAAGDVSVDVRPLSEQDRLSASFLKLRKTLRVLLDEADQLVEAGGQGDLARRGEASGFEGGFRRLVERINALLDAVVHPINEAAEVLSRVADRDLTARMAGTYQGDLNRIKTALNQTIGTLEGAMSRVTDSAEEVASASSQISSGSQSLAQGASEQASTLEEVHSSLQEMAATTDLTASNAQNAKDMSKTADDVSSRGLASVQRLQEAIQRIQESSSSISRVVKTIDEIAFQTNLLALNAAVEAARAGHAGMGFAVVAEEVRNLALRSAEHAKSTASLVEEATRSAASGVEISDEVHENLEKIHSSVGQVTVVMNEIALAAARQSQEVAQIKGAVEQLNQVTQQVAASSEELASASQELSGQADGMKSMVAGFHLQRAAEVHEPGTPVSDDSGPRARTALRARVFVRN